MTRDQWAILVPLICASVMFAGMIIAAILGRRGVGEKGGEEISFDLSEQLNLDWDHAGLFAKKKPLPKGYQTFTPGKPLSLIRQTYTEGRFVYTSAGPYYRVRFHKGPFRIVRCYILEGGTNPEICRVAFYFRNVEISSIVKRLALLAFGSNKVKCTWSDCLIWIVAGFKVRIKGDRIYEVQRARVFEKLGFLFYSFFMRCRLGRR